MLIVYSSIEGYLQPVVAVAGRQSLVQVRRASGILLCIGLLLGYIADIVVVADAGIGANIPVGSSINGRVEGESAVDVPVAVDVLWSRDASTRRRIVAHEVGDGIARMAEIEVGHDGAFAAHDVVVVVCVQRIGERRLQSRITLRDIEWV